MGGMAAFIPSKDPDENKIVTEKVMGDKLLETSNGHDGTWIAHPGLSDIAKIKQKFSSHIKHQVLPNVGHNVPQEDPQSFSSAILEIKSMNWNYKLAIFVGTPNSFLQISAKSFIPSSISLIEGLPKQSRILCLPFGLIDHSLPGFIATPSFSANS